AVEQQDATTRKMAHNVTAVAQSTSVVSEKVTGLASAASETGQSAHMVRDHAGELKNQADALSIQVDQFLTRVRASSPTAPIGALCPTAPLVAEVVELVTCCSIRGSVEACHAKIKSPSGLRGS